MIRLDPMAWALLMVSSGCGGGGAGAEVARPGPAGPAADSSEVDSAPDRCATAADRLVQAEGLANQGRIARAAFVLQGVRSCADVEGRLASLSAKLDASGAGVEALLEQAHRARASGDDVAYYKDLSRAAHALESNAGGRARLVSAVPPSGSLLSWSPDGRRVLEQSRGEEEIRVLNGMTGAAELVLPGATAAWVGAQRVVVGLRRSLQVFDAVSGTPIGEPMELSATTRALHGMGSHVVAQLGMRRFEVWDVERRQVVTDYELAKSADAMFAFAPAAHRIAVGAQHRSEDVEIVAIPSGEVVATQPMRPPPGLELVSLRALVMSPDGKHLAATARVKRGKEYRDTVLVQAIGSAAPARAFDARGTPAFVRDGSALVVGESRWEWPSGKPLSELKGRCFDLIHPTEWKELCDRSLVDLESGAKATLSADWATLPVALARTGARACLGGTVFDARDGKVIARVDVGEQPIALSPDGERLAVSRDDVLEIVDVDRQTIVARVDLTRKPEIAAFGNGHDSDILGDQTYPEFGAPAEGGSPAGLVTFSADGAQVYVASSAGLRVWDATSGSEMPPVANDLPTIIGLKVSPNGRWLAAIAESEVFTWDLEARTRGRRFGRAVPGPFHVSEDLSFYGNRLGFLEIDVFPNGQFVPVWADLASRWPTERTGMRADAFGFFPDGGVALARSGGVHLAHLHSEQVGGGVPIRGTVRGLEVADDGTVAVFGYDRMTFVTPGPADRRWSAPSITSEVWAVGPARHLVALYPGGEYALLEPAGAAHLRCRIGPRAYALELCDALRQETPARLSGPTD